MACRVVVHSLDDVHADVLRKLSVAACKCCAHLSLPAENMHTDKQSMIDECLGLSNNVRLQSVQCNSYYVHHCVNIVYADLEEQIVLY